MPVPFNQDLSPPPRRKFKWVFLSKKRRKAKKRAHKYGHDCAICLCELLGDRKREVGLGCGHCFHKRCIFALVKALRANQPLKCPCCRAVVEEGEERNDDGRWTRLPDGTLQLNLDPNPARVVLHSPRAVPFQQRYIRAEHIGDLDIQLEGRSDLVAEHTPARVIEYPREPGDDGPPVIGRQFVVYGPDVSHW